MNPTKFHFNLPKQQMPDNISIPEVWYPGVKKYWDRSTSNRIFHAINGITTVVIHATAGSTSAGAISVMRDARASFHWLIPDEDEPQHGELIWACAPETLAAWHVRNSLSHPKINDGQKKINHYSLGIELVNSQLSNDAFSDWQVQMTASIVKYCWAKYPNLKHVVSHAMLDPSRRSDPGSLFPWNTFKAQVLDKNVSDLIVFSDAVKSAPSADMIPKSTPTGGACVM